MTINQTITEVNVVKVYVTWNGLVLGEMDLSDTNLVHVPDDLWNTILVWLQQHLYEAAMKQRGTREQGLFLVRSDFTGTVGGRLLNIVAARTGYGNIFWEARDFDQTVVGRGTLSGEAYAEEEGIPEAAWERIRNALTD